MSISGLFNIGHDVGGFIGPVPGPELFARWVQATCLNPRLVVLTLRIKKFVFRCILFFIRNRREGGL